MTTLDQAAAAVASPNHPAANVVSLKWLLRKELWDHLHGKRLYLGGTMCIVLSLLAAFVRVHDYRQAWLERNAFVQRWAPSVEEQLERDETIQVENTRSVSPLTVLSVGLEPVVPFRFTSTKEGLRFGETRGAQNSIDALFGYLDLTFVVSTLLSLLAVAVTFDSICGERAQGTLVLLLSYPIRRSTVLLAKLAGSMIVLAGCFIPAYLLALLYVAISGVPLMSIGHWIAYGLLALLYVLTFATAGLAISARVRRPADAAVACLFAWAFLVCIVPRAVGLVVNQIKPVARNVEITLAEDELVSQLKTDYAKKEQLAFDAYVAAGGDARAMEDLMRSRREALGQLRARRTEVLRRFWEKQSHEEESREELTRALSLLSPAAVLHQAAAELSWTGFRQRSLFYEEARMYDEKIGRRLAESREVYYSGNARGVTNALVTHDNIKPFLIPFSGTWSSPQETLLAVVPPSLTIVAFACFFFIAGAVAFTRMDVRA
ncbi:MAG TPA: ABC transporter permease [Thermoanaerobaculia bacterium]|nr:ABC transporter permease [Thermoanaerobaculia bacterium]